MLAAAMGFAGCAGTDSAVGSGVGGSARPVASGGAGDVADPFAPGGVSIFPLTQLQLDDQGEPWLLLFLELQDRWGDPVKAVGWLTVYLEPEGRPGSVSDHEARWDIDLTDASVNSALFDPVTRTYRVQLGGLPGRAVPMAHRSEQRRAGGDAEGVKGAMVFRAMFRTRGESGDELELWDTFRLES